MSKMNRTSRQCTEIVAVRSLLSIDQQLAELGNDLEETMDAWCGHLNTQVSRYGGILMFA